MKVRLRKELPLYIAFLCITLSWSSFFINEGLQTILEYAGLFLILFGIYVRKYEKSDFKRLGFLILVMFFFSIGLIQQELEISIKLRAILSMFILASVAVMPCKYINRFATYLGIEKAIISGLILSALLSLVTGESILTGASEGIIFEFGFNGGMEHKNYFSYILLCLFIIEFIRYRFNLISGKRNLIVITLFIISTNSRSCYIMLFLFLFVSNINRIKGAKHRATLILSLLCVLFILVGVPGFQMLESKSETFSFRINGLNNYLNMFASDIKHMLFGNLQIAYGFSDLSYDENIRSVIGWDGSTELVIFNVLIKNGLIGFIGYIIIFKRYLKNAASLCDDRLKMIMFALIICFTISSFVESYVANINHLFTVFVYMLLNNMSQIDEYSGGAREAR